MAGFFNFRKQGPLMFRAPRAKTFVSGNSTRTKRSVTGPSRKRKRTFKGKRKSTRKGKSSTLTRLSKRVSVLSKGVDASTGTLTHRALYVASFSVPIGGSKVGQLIMNSFARNAAALTVVPYFDSSTGTIVNVDVSSPLYQNAFRFSSTFIKATLLNNTMTSIQLRVGIMIPRNDTAFGPLAAFSAGLTDIGISAVDPLVRFSDSQALKDLWSWAPGTFKMVTLSPGGHYDISMSLPAYDYEVATSQLEEDVSYKVADRPAVLVYQALGAMHTDVKDHTEINYGEANVTVTAIVTRKITYAAGANIQRTILVNDDTSSTFTTGGVQANQPVAGLQSLT